MKSAKEEAARWFSRIANTPPDDPVRGRFEAWLAASPAHAMEYAAFAALWDDFDSTERLGALAQAVEQRCGAAARDETARRERRRGLLKRGALGLFLCGGAGALAWRGYAAWNARPLHHVALATPIAQMARQILPDGSVLQLNARTALAVTYYRDHREALLARGEAIFEVARDAGRPFTVDAGVARITVLGTRFAVSMLDECVRVSVASGQVSVAGGGPALVLHAGEVAEVTMGATPRRMARSAADAFAWERGTLVFDSATLGEIAESLSRYRPTPVLAVASGPRITAVVQIPDIERFIQTLPAIAPVRVESAGGVTRIVPR